MIKSVEEYLEQLKAELQGSDAATVQDALADAEEHLRAALANLREAEPEISEEDALEQVIEHYGSPAETASAYAEVERRTVPQLTREIPKNTSLGNFFSVYTDARAWGALLYMLITFVTGIFYFIWAITGLSLSVSFSIFIFGLPLALLFLLSVRGLALLEGRLVEALLGVRMPRRPLFTRLGLKWLERLKVLASDKHTWLSLLYLIFQMPLGVIYFSLMVTLIFFSLGFIIIPIVQWVFHFPTYQINSIGYYLPVWSLLLIQLGGFLLLTSTLHLARGIGQLHGRMAKALLVTD